MQETSSVIDVRKLSSSFDRSDFLDLGVSIIVSFSCFVNYLILRRLLPIPSGVPGDRGSDPDYSSVRVRFTMGGPLLLVKLSLKDLCRL